jgi:nitronate monooxygenase
MRTAFTDCFRIEHPLVQAGMAVEAGAALAAAVSNARALGSIGSIGGTPDVLAQAVRACKASEEFAGPPDLKQALVASDGGDTLYDEIFDDACGLDWPNGVTGRALRNRFVREWAGRRDALRAAVAAKPLLGFHGDLNADPATAINWAGESAGLVDAVRPAADIVRELVDDARRHLAAGAALVHA